MSSSPAGYTGIQPSSSPPYAADSVSRTTRIRHLIASAQRPWRELVDLSALSPPISFTEATFRIKKNLYNFRINYTIVLLLILFLSLIYHPISMIVFLIMFVAWLYFYIYRDEPLVVFNWTVDDRIVFVVLSLITIVALIWTHVWLNVVVSLTIWGVLVCFHGAIRAPDDFDDLESPYGALLSGDSPTGAFSLF